jgi:Uma2 family endonuclease
MSAVVEPAASRAPVAPQALSSRASPIENRLVLHDVDWATYDMLLHAFGTRRIRLTYDRGTLEIVTGLRRHEWWESRVGYLIPLLGAHWGIDVQPSGSPTLRREDLGRGLEPDDSFHVRHAAVMVGPRELDLTVDPPPDLVLEVEISRSLSDRIGIYAALSVPEVWRCGGERILVCLLRGNTYVEVERSASFPPLPLDAFVLFLKETDQLSEAALTKLFLAWLKQNVPIEVS